MNTYKQVAEIYYKNPNDIDMHVLININPGMTIDEVEQEIMRAHPLFQNELKVVRIGKDPFDVNKYTDKPIKFGVVFEVY